MSAPMYVTSQSGLVHHWNCPRIRGDVWVWNPRNDGPGVNKACAKCLPDGLPGEAS